MDTRRRRSHVPLTAKPRRHKPDYWLLILATMLLVVGVIVVYAISPALSLQANVSQSYYVNKQLLAIAVSVVAFIAAANIPLAVWRRSYKLLLGLAAVATLLALLLPVNAQYPAHRWIRLGSFSFQSVELLKFALLVWFAGFLAMRSQLAELTSSRKVLWPLLATIVAVGIVVAGVQSDLGSAGVIVLMLGAMAFVAGMPFRKLLSIGAIVLIIAVLAISAIPYRRDRLLSYLHPSSSCLTTGYQECQALIAVGSGGMVGLGLGRSVQAYGYTPEAQNDSIFAIYAEEFGFVGVVVLFGLFIAFFARLKNIVERAPDDFTRLLATGILAWFSTQAFINIGAMIGLLPLKGITLPFISYGGTSVLFVMAAVGLTFQISRYTHFSVPVKDYEGGKQHDDPALRRGFRGAYHPAPGGRH